MVAATSDEIDPLLKFYSLSSDPSRFLSLTQEKYSLHILITGVGMVNTTYHLTKTLPSLHPDIAINAGIAGSFSNQFSIGDVVRVGEDYFADMGAEDGKNFLSIDDLGFDSSKVCDEKSMHLIPEIFSNLASVRSISVNRVHGSEESIDEVRRRLNPDIETMEGAAFTKVCMEEGIPQIQIRSISNKVERRNRSAWNIPLAVQNLNQYLLQIIPRIT